MNVEVLVQFLEPLCLHTAKGLRMSRNQEKPPTSAARIGIEYSLDASDRP